MLRSNVGGISLDCCVYNAAGPRTSTLEELVAIGESRSGAILSKSTTPACQKGNPKFPQIIDLGEHCSGSFNTAGISDHEINYYISTEVTEKLCVFEKPYIISIAGLSLKDNLEMIERIGQVTGVSAIELNLSCPNLVGRPIIAYDFEQMETSLQAVTSHPSFSNKPLGIKLAPYLDNSMLSTVVSIIAKFPVKYIVTANSIGNAMFIDSEHECMAIAATYGGLSGGYIKPVVLSNVRSLTQLLKEADREDIDIVGVGGVANGTDAFELILCGAKAVQVATQHWKEGPNCFNRIADELEAIMKAKGYTSIEDFRGKLKPNLFSANGDPCLIEHGRNQKQKYKSLVSLWSFFFFPENLLLFQWAVIAILVAIIIFPLYARGRVSKEIELTNLTLHDIGLYFLF